MNPDKAAVEQFIKINDAYTILSESIQANEQRQQAAQPVGEQSPDEASVSAAMPSPSEASATSSPISDADEGLFNRLNSIRLTLENLGFDTFEDDADSAASNSVEVSETKDSPPFHREETLKRDTYNQLKTLLKQQKFPRAIALIEGLAHRMPQDSEIVQWQAIVYQRWGRQLIQEGQTHKARIYLKKALRTDPDNRSLWREVNRDFWQLASLGI